MTEISHEALSAELERARNDYLAVSRGAHLYASPADHEEAERRAWERLEMALASSQQVPETSGASA